MAKIKLQKKILSNGMTLLFEKRDIPVVSIAFAVRAGGINEKEEEKGISHFIEHMLYKGTPTRSSKKIAVEIEKNGGVLNGFTEEEITAFWCKIPSRHLNVALDVLSDMVKNPLFDEKEIEKERKVIFEEIKMIKDNPVVYCMDKITGYLYEGALATSLIGTEKTLRQIDKNGLLKKFRQVYHPNNMILCVVGDADFEKISDFAEKNFDKEKGSVPQIKISERNKVGQEERQGLAQSNLIFAYRIPHAGDKKAYAAEVLNAIMAVGMSSRLFHEIREKRNLAYAVKGDCDINRDYAFGFIYVGTDRENVEKVKEIIIEEFEIVSRELGEKEFSEAKEQIIGNYQISMEDSQSQMASLLAYEIAEGAEEYYNYEKNISDVKIEDVRELAEKASKEFSFFALVPKKE